MKDLFKNIAMVVMLIAFLVSVSGFQVIRHTCPSCNIVEYTLHQPEACCGVNAQPMPAEPVSCCTVPEDTHSCSNEIETTSCCEYESEFFVVDELIITQKLKVEAPLASLPVITGYLELPEAVEDHVFMAAFLHPPPPVFSGTDYLFFLQQLKIAYC